MIITLNLISKLTSFPIDEIAIKKPGTRREPPRLTSYCIVVSWGEKGINLSCKSVLGMVGRGGSMSCHKGGIKVQKQGSRKEAKYSSYKLKMSRLDMFLHCCDA